MQQNNQFCGCQRKIAEKIYDCKADYVLAVKDNESKLKQFLEKNFMQLPCQFQLVVFELRFS
ncbi:hypothetical protein GAMM_110057 [Gammaproteobacteria bacterium]